MLVNKNTEERTIKANDWENMEINDLIQQKNVLEDRYDYMASINPESAATILTGIKKIEAILASKRQG